jgi:hypothetical protein
MTSSRSLQSRQYCWLRDHSDIRLRISMTDNDDPLKPNIRVCGWLVPSLSLCRARIVTCKVGKKKVESEIGG